MHVLAGLLLILVAFGAVFIVTQMGVLQPVTGAFHGVFGGGLNASSTANRSTVYGEVKVDFVSTGAGADKTMAVSLKAHPVEQEGIVLSGWKLKTSRGTYVIPKAANIYSPSVEGIPPENIYVREGGVVNFYSGQNPNKDQPQAIRAGEGEWRIWLGKSFLTVPHGTITVLDEKGKIVDEYKY